MRAYMFDELKQPGSLRDVAVPACGPSEIRIRVTRAGVNPIDWKIRSGEAGAFPTPRVAGQDVAGVVEAIGSAVKGFAVGDRVVACARSHGGYAELTVIGVDAHGEPVSKIPNGVGDTVAAALPTPGLTALGALDALDVGKGTVVLILGAAGAVGAIAVQLATKRGATVLATVKGSGASDVRMFGAEMVIDSGDAAEIVAQVRDAYPDGIATVLDLVSDGEQLKVLASVLKPGGKILTTVHVGDEPWFSERGYTAINFSMADSPDASPAGLDTLTAAVKDGSLRIDIAAERPLDDARSLLDSGAGHALHGKTVLTLN